MLRSNTCIDYNKKKTKKKNIVCLTCFHKDNTFRMRNKNILEEPNTLDRQNLYICVHKPPIHYALGEIVS